MKPLEVAVAGCGPCGLATALLLGRDGHRVTIHERFAEPRPIGSGLMIQPTGLAVLRELGLGEATVSAGARIERLFGRAEPSGRIVLDVRYRALAGAESRFGIGLHRAALFGILHRAVSEAGIPIETGRTITASETAAGNRGRLVFADGTRGRAVDLVVDALGSRTPLAPQTGGDLAYGALWASLVEPQGVFDGTALEQRYRAARQMTGVLPLGRPFGREPMVAFFWSLRADRLEDWRAGGLAAWKAEVRDLWPATEPLLDQIETPDQLTFARYGHRTLASPAEPGLIHLGDAWHATSPQLGQGANMALLDALALATALRGAPSVGDALARAVALRRRHVRLYQAMSRLFTPVYQSDGRILPVLRDRVAGPLSRVPPMPRLLAATVGGLVGAPLGGLGLRDEAASPVLAGAPGDARAGG